MGKKFAIDHNSIPFGLTWSHIYKLFKRVLPPCAFENSSRVLFDLIHFACNMPSIPKRSKFSCNFSKQKGRIIKLFSNLFPLCRLRFSCPCHCCRVLSVFRLLLCFAKKKYVVLLSTYGAQLYYIILTYIHI